jgi:NTE family protein
MKIGLSLSGGGVRATVFHLGALARLAETPRWSEITFLSTVSGGSLCAALVFENAGQQWPSADVFRHEVLPKVRTQLTTFDLERRYMLLTVLNPRWWCSGRAPLIAKLIRKHWGIVGDVSQMPDLPRWEICATCYETGKSFRFSRKRMGDYVTNYVVAPKFPLADAVAASAAVPGLIGPLMLDATKFKWHKYGSGGVYENLGVEALYKPQEGLRKEIDFLIISDASRPLMLETRRLQFGLPPYKPPFRLIDVATEQARALRLRTFIGFLNQSPRSGLVLAMGNTVDQIVRKANSKRAARWTTRTFLDEPAVRRVAGMPTTLRQLSESEYDLVFRHGYEVAEATMHAYNHSAFDPVFDVSNERHGLSIGALE